GGVRAPAARRDARRFDAVHTMGRGRGRLGAADAGAGGLGEQRDAAGVLRGGELGAGGRQAPRGAGWTRMAPDVASSLDRLEDHAVSIEPAAIEGEFARIWREGADAGPDDSARLLRAVN